jgi:hypothetical protein
MQGKQSELSGMSNAPFLPLIFNIILARLMEKKSVSEIVTQLQHAQHDLEDLACHITAFADWWSIQVVGLKALVSVIPQIQVDGSNRLRTVNVRRRWEQVTEQYLMYSSKVTFLMCACDRHH